MGDFAPTDQAVAVQKMLFDEIDAVLVEWGKLVETEVPVFNRMVKEADLPGGGCGVVFLAQEFISGQEKTEKVY